MHTKITALGLSLLLTNALIAQKKPIDHTVYDSWESVQNATISKSGKFIYYQIEPQEGDGKLELKNSKNQLLLTADRAKNIVLTEDEDYLLATISPTFAEIREAKIKKKKPDNMPKDSLLIFNVKKNEQEKIAAVKSYKTAQNNNNFLAYLQEQKLSQDSTNTKKETTVPVLVLKNLSTGDTSRFTHTDQYVFSQDEKYLAFTKKGQEKDSLFNDAGLYMYDIAAKNLKKISTGTGNYKELRFDDQSQQFIFLADKSPEKSLSKNFKLYYYTNALDSAHVITDQNSQGVPQNWQVSGDGSLVFSATGNKIFLGLAPIPKVKDTTLVDFEHANVDIWHWQDDYLQSQQLVNLKRDQSKNFVAVIYPKENNRLISLVDDSFNHTTFTDERDNEWMLATTDINRRISAQWEGNTQSDVYLVSTSTGNKKLVVKDLLGASYLDPRGNFVLYFDSKTSNLFSYDIQKNTTTQLNDGVPVSFSNEENDMPMNPSPYGIAGWSADGKGVFIYDRYDIWYFDFSGKQKRIATNGDGRARKIVYRYLHLEPRDNPRYRSIIIPDKKQIYLTAFDETTKQNGFYRINSNRQQRPSEILMSLHTYKTVRTSKDHKLFLYTKENYQSAPNLFMSSNFKSDEPLTAINQKQAEYNWGTAELVRWTTPGGHQAEGILYKPENFDPNKQYPIIAYFYERLSDGLYTYHPPAPTPSRLNIPYYVSNEYLVFAPDIRYETGHPGKAAEEYVNSGMNELSKLPWVDGSKMAIQGQSWGGYQVAHLITRTDMYAAAWAGAPVVNMTSAYGGIRWATGMNRQFQYERTQSRIGQNLWEAHDLYIENSPLFYLDRVSTPVAIMHNDNDGAVPWYQGIEMFTALRRLQKPVWLLNYNNDEHNLIKRQNRKDIQIRQSQFFDHFLKEKPAPKWIKTGIPAIEKGIDWGFEQ